MLITLNTLLLIGVAILLLYLWTLYNYGYWKRRNVFSPPTKLLLGNMENAISKYSIGFHFANLYEKYKKHPLVGVYVMFFNKTLMVNDLDHVKLVLSKDYSYFQGHGFKINKEADPLSQHLFNLEGEEWKRIRVKLTPTFTSSKMKFMFDTMKVCSDVMVDYLKDASSKSVDVIDFKEIVAKLGTDVIGSCAFGLETNSFKNPDAEFRKHGKMIFVSNFWSILVDVASLLTPDLMLKLKVPRMSKRLISFFENIVKQTIEYRTANNIRSNDFLQILIDMKNSNDEADSLTIKEIIPQVFVFFVAGFETSSSTAMYALLELAKNPDIRDKVVEHIEDILEKNGGEMTYDNLAKMDYLTQTAQESLRMYPPVPFLFRRCTKNYKFPNSDVVIESGTPVMIPILGIQRDPDIYPNPLQFDPDRFSPENVKNRHPFAHIPFGEGPRICIGSRFGMMQVKLALAMILLNFKVELSEKTQLPLKYDRKAVLLHTEGEMLLKFTPRKKIQ